MKLRRYPHRSKCGRRLDASNRAAGIGTPLPHQRPVCSDGANTWVIGSCQSHHPAFLSLPLYFTQFYNSARVAQLHLV